MQYINLINYINNIVEFNKEEFIFFKSKYKLFGIIFVPSINHYKDFKGKLNIIILLV